MKKISAVLLISMLLLVTFLCIYRSEPLIKSKANLSSYGKKKAYAEKPNAEYKPIVKARAVWADPTFEYRRAITITETAGVTLPPESFPIEIYVTFDPPAYFESQTSHSIRLYRGLTEIPIQIYNVSWYDYSQKLIKGATIAFYADLQASTSTTYYLYWSDKPTTQVSYPKCVSYTLLSTGYVFSTDMYDVETKNDLGGKIYRISMGGIDIIHGSDDYMDKSAHFTPIYNPIYSDATIGSAPVLALNGHYMGGISDNSNHQQPQITIAGPIFVEYKVEDVALMQGDTTIAYADITYRFYKYFFVVKEEIKFASSISGEIWIGGWHVDQDDGDGAGVFDFVYMDTDSINGYSYPYNMSYVESQDYADVAYSSSTGSKTIWTRFYVFNSTWRFGLGYLLMSHNAYQVNITDMDSYWINEGSSNDWTIPFSASGSLDTDGSDSWSFYVMAGRRVYVSYHFTIADRFGIADDANIDVWIEDPNGNVVPGQYYSSGEPAPEEATISFDFVASITGWYRLVFDYDSADDFGFNDDRMWWDSYMLYLTSNSYFIYDDYLLWSNRIQLTASTDSMISEKYSIIPWYNESSDWYNLIASEISNPPQKSISSIVEQYYSFVTIKVLDKDHKPIPNANVYLDGVNDYNGSTDSNGEVTFKVERDYYVVNVNLTSKNLTYTNTTTLSISQDFSLDKHVNYTFVMDVVKLSVKFVAADNVTILQGAKLVLSHSLYGNVSLTSDLEGRDSVYLRPATWWVGKLEAAYPGTLYDNFTILDALTEDPIVQNVKETTIDVLRYHSWVLIDHMANETKPSSKFEIYYGSPAQSVQWGTTLTWLIKWVDQFGSELDLSIDGNETTDFFSWEVRDSSTDEVVTLSDGSRLRYYYTPSNVSACMDYSNDIPLYKISLNTSLLSADKTYYIVVDGYINIRQKPPMMYLFFDVDSIPTVNTLDAPTQVYWNETLDVTFYIWDSSGNPLSGANVELTLYDESMSVINQTMMPETQVGVYTLTLKCSFPPGHYYLQISYSKPNYASGYVPTKDIFVLSRPTALRLTGFSPMPIASSSEFVKVYWGNYTLRLSFEYLDSLRLTSVLESSIDAKVYRITPQGNVLMYSPTFIYNATSQTYDAELNISNMDVGVYALSVEFSKINYESQKTSITVIVEKRPTNIVLGSDYITSYYGEPTSATFYLEDLLSRRPVTLSNNDVSVRVRDLTRGTTVDALVTILSNGTCTIYYPSNLMPSKYVTKIQISKPNYQEISKELYLEVKERPTYIASNRRSVSVVWGDEVLVYFWYIDMINGSPIYAENMSVKIIGKSNFVIPIAVSLQLSLYQGSIAYVLRFNSSLLRSGETYDVYVWFDRRYYEEKSLVIKLTVNPIALKIYYSEEVTVYKNPIDSSGKLYYSFELRDVSEGHNEKPFRADEVRYELLGGYKVLASGTANYSDGRYSFNIDVTKLEVGSYRLRIYIVAGNATITNAKGGIVNVLVKVDYFGGSVELFGRKMPVLVVVPSLVGVFLALGGGIYYLWIYVHIPWEVKYLNRLIKLVKGGYKEFEPVDRTEDINKIALELMK